MLNRPPVRIAVTRFEDIVAHGLRALIIDDESLSLVADGVPHEKLASALADHQPNVVILNFGSLESASVLRDLHREFPDVRLVVLANRPTPGECRQMIAFGATACLAKSAARATSCTRSTLLREDCMFYRRPARTRPAWAAPTC